MSFVVPQFTKGAVNRAGDVLAGKVPATFYERLEASDILANWRGCHAYPINTFQATLRSKLKGIDPAALVAQRLKRAPSILAKLQRFDGMQLARMQDIGGLRAVVDQMSDLLALVANYRTSRFPQNYSGQKTTSPHRKMTVTGAITWFTVTEIRRLLNTMD